MPVAIETPELKEELAAIEVAAKNIQMAQGALEKHTPETLKRIIPFLAQHVVPDSQSRANMENALWVIAGFNPHPDAR